MVIKLAKQLIAQKVLFLDTETTGLGFTDEIVEIAVLEIDGTPLLDTLVKPTISISNTASIIHGIDEYDIAGAPSFAEVLPRLLTITDNRTVVIYNADFDMRMLRQSARAHNMRVELRCGIHCAMLMYAEFCGEWDHSRGKYRWHKLEAAAKRCNIHLPQNVHRARFDAELTRQIVTHIAEAD